MLNMVLIEVCRHLFHLRLQIKIPNTNLLFSRTHSTGISIISMIFTTYVKYIFLNRRSPISHSSIGPPGIVSDGQSVPATQYHRIDEIYLFYFIYSVTVLT